MITLIAAMSENRVIGLNGKIPWYIKGEQKMFKELTLGKVVIMGRKTYESIGRALPGRVNIVITRNRRFTAPDAIVTYSVNDAIEIAKGLSNKIFVIGGASVYLEAMPFADIILISLIKRNFHGDARFPEISANEFSKIEKTEVSAEIPYSIIKYKRIGPTKTL